MKKTVIITALFASFFVFQGCDAFRKLAGRPTSKDIEAKREIIVREQEAHQKRLDSLKIVQKQISDSLAVLDSIRNSGDRLVDGRKLSEESKSSLPYRYYVVAGTFANYDNAVKYAGQAEKAGYTATLIRYRNSFTAVALCPSNSLTEVYASMRQVRTGALNSKDAWIIDKEK